MCDNKMVVCVFLIGFCLFGINLGAESNYDFIVRVIGEDGKAIEGVPVEFGFYSRKIDLPEQTKTVASDANGFVAFRGSADDLGLLKVNLEGYYRAMEKPAAYLSRGWKDGRHLDWEPAGKIIDLILKKKGAKVPMFAKTDRKEMPESKLGQRFGYDLELGDFVMPNGLGKRADLFFVAQVSGNNSEELRWILSVEFPNGGDGIFSLHSPVGSDAYTFRGGDMRSPTVAPLVGYSSSIQFSNDGNSQSRGSSDYIYIFRVRAELDSFGGVKSAWYGKIYKSPWIERIVDSNSGGVKNWLWFNYYLNPDGTRNLEFDGKKNLFQNLKPFQLPTGN